ncbi:hypothetical protein [Caballeronia cordobensis]|uniref:hypothetical protein n=1 Tax=Caballeronia cordobensis TaxID=1353886 RepID=UPI00045F0863|nr:putative membrane protein [Burkholderia sp. RPE67]
MLELLVSAALAHAQEKLPGAALAGFNRLLTPIVKRRLGVLKETYMGGSRPRNDHVILAAWAAFHSAIAEVIEASQATLRLQIAEVNRETNPSLMDSLVQQANMLATLRRTFDKHSSEAKFKLIQDSEVPLPWDDHVFSNLASAINWAPTQESNRLEYSIDLRLKELAIDRLNSLSSTHPSHYEFSHEKIRQLAPGGEFASMFFRHFASLADQHSVIWRPLISQQIGQLQNEIKSAMREASALAERAVSQSFEKCNLLEPRHWIKGVEHLKAELRGEGRRTDTRHFGGRVTEMGALDRWLNKSSSSRFLLTGPSGIGKSVLVQRWLDIKAFENIWNVIHIPFARSPYDTADHTRALLYLCIRLSSITETYGLAAGYRSVDDLADTLELVLDQLGEKRILIAFDGLDELDDPDSFIRLLPKTFPPSLKVLFSARTVLGTSTHATWADRLEMSAESDALELDFLGADGLRTALLEYGYAPCEEHFSQLTHRLYILTDAGDPLLFGFLMTDEKLLTTLSAARALEIADTWKEGYRTLFERWIDQEEAYWSRSLISHEARQPCFIVLVLIAVAPAPLTDRELLVLLPRIINSQLISVRGLLRPIQRLLVGDGQQGYQLSHPRLAEVILKPGVLMEQRQLTNVKSVLYEWMLAELKQHEGSDELDPYVARNGTRIFIFEMENRLDKIPYFFKSSFIKTCVKLGLSSQTYALISLYLKEYFLAEIASTSCSPRDIAQALLRLGLFVGSLPTPLQNIKSVPALASAVEWGNLSSEEAYAWIDESDRYDLFLRAWPREQSDTIYPLRPDQYRLPIIYFYLNEPTQNTVRVDADAKSFDVGCSSSWNYTYEGDAYLATVFLLLSFRHAHLRTNAERLLVTLPSYRAASCISTVKEYLPESPAWLRELSIRVHTACIERRNRKHEETETFDELFDWLTVEEAAFAPHLERLFQLVKTEKLDPWWPPRRRYSSPLLDELERLVKLAGVSEHALDRSLQLFEQVTNNDTRKVKCAYALAPFNKEISSLIECWRKDIDDFQDADLAGPMASILYGGLKNVPDENFEILKRNNPRFALGLSNSDTIGITDKRALSLAESANRLDGPERLSALLAIAANSKKINADIFKELMADRDWLFHDAIISTLLRYSSDLPRYSLIETLTGHANLLSGKLYAKAFEPLIQSRDPSMRSLLINLISALPECTLRVHLAFLAGNEDDFGDKSHQLAQSIDGDSLACKCLREAWAGRRWSRHCEPLPSQFIENIELRGFFCDFFPSVLEGHFDEDETLLSLLDPEDWVTIALNLPIDALNSIVERRRQDKERLTQHYLALMTCAVARTLRFEVVREFPFRGNLGPWFGVLGNIGDSENPSLAIATIEAEILDARSGGYGQGWRLLVTSKMATRPDVAAWIAGLYKEQGWGGLGLFGDLPKLAPSFNICSIKQLRHLKMKHSDRLRCAIASRDFATRQYGYRILERLARREAESVSMLGDPVDFEYDNWFFTSEYILSSVLAEGSTSQQIAVVDRMKKNRECDFRPRKRSAAFYPILNFVVNFIEKSAPADSQALADASCMLIAEFIN